MAHQWVFGQLAELLLGVLKDQLVLLLFEGFSYGFI